MFSDSYTEHTQIGKREPSEGGGGDSKLEGSGVRK